VSTSVFRTRGAAVAWADRVGATRFQSKGGYVATHPDYPDLTCYGETDLAAMSRLCWLIDERKAHDEQDRDFPW